MAMMGWHHCPKLHRENTAGLRGLCQAPQGNSSAPLEICLLNTLYHVCLRTYSKSSAGLIEIVLNDRWHLGTCREWRKPWICLVKAWVNVYCSHGHSQYEDQDFELMGNCQSLSYVVQAWNWQSLLPSGPRPQDFLPKLGSSSHCGVHSKHREALGCGSVGTAPSDLTGH